MIWLVVATASAVVLGIFLWLALGKVVEPIYGDPRKYHWSVLDDVDPGWVEMNRKARERMWNEEKRAELEELLKKAIKMEKENS